MGKRVQTGLILPDVLVPRHLDLIHTYDRVEGQDSVAHHGARRRRDHRLLCEALQSTSGSETNP